MKTCRTCTLNDNIFSVSIDEAGICNHCNRQHAGEAKANNDIAEAARKEKQFKEACNAYMDQPYQILLAYSGGKDSTYALYTLRQKYGLSVLTVTFDNGFLTRQCMENIHEVTARLDVDNITIKPSFARLARVFDHAGSNEIFPRKSLERASSICTACIGFVKASVYKEAILRRIPFVSFGWTPGQTSLKASVVKLDHRMIYANQMQIAGPLAERFGNEFQRYFMDESWLESQKEYIPYLAHPLMFTRYDEQEILETITGIGWRKPEDTDMNSTNCLLNSYANELHAVQYGYNPYCLEIATLVRTGVLSREEGLRKLEGQGRQDVIEHVCSEIGKYAGREMERRI